VKHCKIDILATVILSYSSWSGVSLDFSVLTGRKKDRMPPLLDMIMDRQPDRQPERMRHGRPAEAVDKVDAKRVVVESVST